MAKTLSNAQVGVRIYLDESQQTDFLDSEVNIAINFAYHDVIAHIIEVYELFYETITPFTYTLIANQQEYAIDSTLIKVTRVEINYQPNTLNSAALRAIPIKSDELRLNLANSNTSGTYFNAGYYLHGNIGNQQIGFVPVPVNGDTTGKSISVWGIAMPSDLVNTTDNINIPYADRFVQLINLKAASILLRKGQQEETAAARYSVEYEAGIKEMQTFLKERQADDTWMIEDSALEDIDFQVTDNL